MSHSDALDMLFISPERFRASPQVGTRLRLTWGEVATWLRSPSVGDRKDVAGAWSPGLYRGDVRRKVALVSIGALVIDVDDCGDVDTAADLVGRYAAIVHETFSSTNDAPRCRVVLLLASPVDAASYEGTHRVVRAHLARAGLPPDESAKDASRASYLPVRRPGAGYRFRLVDGVPLDAGAVLAAQPPPPPRSAPRLAAREHADAYVRGALRRAAAAVASASPGGRHHALSREAFTLARLDVGGGTIASALVPAFVAVAGEGRRREGERTVRDAIRAARFGGAA